MKPKKYLQMLLVLIVALCHGAGAAHAEDGLVLIGGTVTEPMRATATAAVEDAARQAGWSVAARRLPKKELDGLIRCLESSPFTCLPLALTAGGIHRLLVVTVDRATSDAAASEIVLSGKLIVTSSRDVVVDRRLCESCAEARLAQEATSLAESLLRLLATQLGHTTLEIKSEPLGAQIALDGQRIGLTNSSYTTYPGKHLITLERDGYLPETVDLSIDEGTMVRIFRVLRPKGVPGGVSASASKSVPVKLRSERRSLVLPTIMIAVGTAAIIGGIALYMVDRELDPVNEDEERNTAPAGVALGTTGLVTAAAGTYLWWSWAF